MSMPDHEGAPSGASQPSDRGGRFNVSRWALEHPALTRYLMVVLMLLGAAAYRTAAFLFHGAPFLAGMVGIEVAMGTVLIIASRVLGRGREGNG